MHILIRSRILSFVHCLTKLPDPVLHNLGAAASKGAANLLKGYCSWIMFVQFFLSKNVKSCL